MSVPALFLAKARTSVPATMTTPWQRLRSCRELSFRHPLAAGWCESMRRRECLRCIAALRSASFFVHRGQRRVAPMHFDSASQGSLLLRCIPNGDNRKCAQPSPDFKGLYVLSKVWSHCRRVRRTNEKKNIPRTTIIPRSYQSWSRQLCL